jgi:FlaA1/EpsC-like NDP-sugar epimerase
MLEHNPCEAVLNNVLGSSVLMRAAREQQVGRVVLVSTDKAVNPVNVMGATKRLAEQIMTSSNEGATKFVAVRFGNVVGSSGSVVPLFKQQIANGGPVRVTDPEITRYFMTISEAAQLILQSGALGRGGEIFILDMGTPIRIVDMARDLIRLMGKEPGEDVDIRFTGLRAGEKMNEELYSREESLVRTTHDKILVVRPNSSNPRDLSAPSEKFESLLLDLFESARSQDEKLVRQRLRELVPEYARGSGEGERVLQAAK